MKRVLLCVGCAFFCLTACSEDKAIPRESIGSIEVLRISMPIDTDVQLQLVVRNKELIKRLIQAPVEAAKPDPKPADYRAFASLTLEDNKGVTESMQLFEPLGHFKRHGKYYIADLGELRKYLKKIAESRALKPVAKDE
jgi:hypothetical protein